MRPGRYWTLVEKYPWLPEVTGMRKLVERVLAHQQAGRSIDSFGEAIIDTIRSIHYIKIQEFDRLNQELPVRERQEVHDRVHGSVSVTRSGHVFLLEGRHPGQIAAIAEPPGGEEGSVRDMLVAIDKKGGRVRGVMRTLAFDGSHTPEQLARAGQPGDELATTFGFEIYILS